MSPDDASSSIMVAALPVDANWVQQDLPHLTLVYGGEVSEASSKTRKDLYTMTFLLSFMMSPLTLPALGVAQFGEGVEKVDVLRLIASPALVSARQLLAPYSKSEYKVLKPHVTIGPVGSASRVELPSRVHFDRLLFSWGDEYLVLPLR